jgi:hypothetical protein
MAPPMTNAAPGPAATRQAKRTWRPAPLVLFAILFGTLFLWEIFVLFLQVSGVPMTERGESPRLVGEVAGNSTVAQSFGVHAGGLSGVTIHVRPFGEEVAGDVVFTLSDSHSAILEICAPVSPPGRDRRISPRRRLPAPLSPRVRSSRERRFA